MGLRCATGLSCPLHCLPSSHHGCSRALWQSMPVGCAPPCTAIVHPQPLFLRPCGHHQYRTAAHKANAKSPSCTHCQPGSFVTLLLAGWRWHPQAGRNLTRKKAARRKSNPNPGINRGFAHAKGQCSAQIEQQCHRWKRYSSPHAYRALEANCPGQSLAVRLDHFFVRSVPMEITAGDRALQAAPSNQKNV